MANILYSDYTTAKTAADNAYYTVTGQHYTWTQVVGQGTKVDAANITEIKNAVDVAYNAINTGCASNCTGYCSGNNSSVLSVNREPDASSSSNSYNSTINTSNYSNNSTNGYNRSSNRGAQKVNCGKNT